MVCVFLQSFYYLKHPLCSFWMVLAENKFRYEWQTWVISMYSFIHLIGQLIDREIIWKVGTQTKSTY